MRTRPELTMTARLWYWYLNQFKNVYFVGKGKTKIFYFKEVTHDNILCRHVRPPQKLFEYYSDTSQNLDVYVDESYYHAMERIKNAKRR